MKFYITAYSSNHCEGFIGEKLYPHVELVTDDWDDFYKYETLFRAYLYLSENNCVPLGEVKILSEDHNITRHHIDKYFEILDTTYCSLGQSVDYYHNLRSLDKHQAYEILNALNDIAIKQDIFESFKNRDGINSSLRRFSEAEKAFIEAKNILEDKETQKNLEFTFEFSLDNVEKSHRVHFNFNKDNDLPNRINVLVGKNGTGKTKVLSNLASILSGLKNSNSSFYDDIRPSFSRYIAISYSVFDDFNKPFNEHSKRNVGDITEYAQIIDQNIMKLKSKLEKNEENIDLLDSIEILQEDLGEIRKNEKYIEILNNRDRINEYDNVYFSYVYCGLRNKSGIMTEEQIRYKFIESYKNIIHNGRKKDWFDILSEIIDDKNILCEIEECINPDTDKVNSAFEKLSSGQSIMLFIITEVIKNIKDESLLLFDEPEIHLHPNSISNFMRMFNLLLEKFNSYAIISTHSPIIVQEVPSKYVRVFQKNEDSTYITHNLYEECFGENLSNITNYVFDVIEKESNYKSFFKKISKILNKEEVLKLFNNDLSFNALTYLNSLYHNSEKENM